MKKTEISSVALKCFAIWGIFSVLTRAPALMNFLTQANNFGSGKGPSYFVAITYIVLTIVISSICIWVIWRIANSLVIAKQDQKEETLNLDISYLMKTIFICMGFYFVVNSAFSFPYHYLSFTVKDLNDPARSLEKLDMAVSVVKIVFGCLLIAKPNQWVRAIRSIGHKNLEQVH